MSRRVGRRHELRLDLGRCAESRLIEGCQIVLHRPAGGFAIALLVPLLARDRALTVGVGLDQAGIDREALATNQAGLDAGPHDAFEDVAEEIALAKALGARTAEGGVIGDRIFQVKVAKPPIREVDLNLPAKLALRPDGEHVADDQHPDHQHRIDRRAADPGIVGRQLRVDPGQVQNGIDLADQVIVRNHLVEVELIKQVPLAPYPPTHHLQLPLPIELANGITTLAGLQRTFATLSPQQIG